MASKMILGIGLLAALVGLAGCAADRPAVVRIADPDQALAALHELGASRNFDLSRVTVVRLKLDGEPLEVTSLLPALIARAETTGPPAATMFVFGQAPDRLILFTRAGAGGGGYRLELPVADWRPGEPVRFPVVNADGTVTERQVELVKFIVR